MKCHDCIQPLNSAVATNLTGFYQTICPNGGTGGGSSATGSTTAGAATSAGSTGGNAATGSAKVSSGERIGVGLGMMGVLMISIGGILANI